MQRFQRLRHPRLIKIVIAIALVLLVVRAAAPIVIKNVLNDKLAELPGYRGHVADVDLAVWRGGFAVDGVEFYKTSLSRKEPMLTADRIASSILWGALFRGDVVVDSRVTKPRLQIVAESTPEATTETKETAKDTGEASEDVLKELPVKIDRFEVVDGYVGFEKLDTTPQIKVFMSDIDLEVSNLTNSKRLAEAMAATVVMTGKAMGQGDFSLNLALDPLAQPIDFELRSKMLNLPAKTLNPITKEYGKFDFEKGNVDLVVEVDAKDGQLSGYVKPLLQNIAVLGEEDKERDDDSPLRRAWEALIGATEEVVDNDPAAQSGTRIPISGSLESPNSNIFTIVVEVLRNAYVRALVPDYEDS